MKEFYFDDKHWTIRYLVADTGNWLTGNKVLISPYTLVSYGGSIKVLKSVLKPEVIIAQADIGGTVAKLLNSVNGTTGKSFTNIRKLDIGLNVTYSNWQVYNGYLNIYQTSVNLSNIISQGNIGPN